MATADNHQHTPPRVCLDYKWRQDMEIGPWHIAREGEEGGRRDGENESRRVREKEKGARRRDVLAPASDAFFVHVELVCFSPSARAGSVIFPRCERIDAVHAKPAGGRPTAVNWRFVFFRFFLLVAARQQWGSAGMRHSQWMDVDLVEVVYCVYYQH